MRRCERGTTRLTALIVLGVGLTYIAQLCVSPILPDIRDGFGLRSDAVINLAVDIVFPFIVLGCLAGGVLAKKLSLHALFSLVLLVSGCGLLSTLIPGGYVLFLAGRAVFGFGFGLGVPFIGSAIMTWYPADKRERMDTVNGFFPFIGTTVCFLTMAPLAGLWGSWRGAVAVWGVGMLVLFVCWAALVRPGRIPRYDAADPGGGQESYRALWRRREIRLICITYICDLCCYSYLALILPTFLQESSGLSQSAANVIAAVAFPIAGLLGCLAGGAIMARSGLRKPLLVMGQVLKMAGILIAAPLSGGRFAMIVAGVIVFGLGNSLWMPPVYCVPMDLEGMTPHSVGAAFALMTALGMLAGFVAPTLGGLLTTAFLRGASEVGPAAHAAALRMSLAVFSLFNVPAILCMALLPETGQRK